MLVLGRVFGFISFFEFPKSFSIRPSSWFFCCLQMLQKKADWNCRLFHVEILFWWRGGLLAVPVPIVHPPPPVTIGGCEKPTQFFKSRDGIWSLRSFEKLLLHKTCQGIRVANIFPSSSLICHLNKKHWLFKRFTTNLRQHPGKSHLGPRDGDMLVFHSRRLCQHVQITPLKINMSPENKWLEDVFRTKIVPF